MEKQLTCIQCPNGCRLTAVVHEDGSVTVTGNLCKRGEEFAVSEVTDPRRSVTTTIRTTFSELPRLPVRTSFEVRKADVPAVMAAAHAAVIDRRLSTGDIAVRDAGGTGADLLATMDL